MCKPTRETVLAAATFQIVVRTVAAERMRAAAMELDAAINILAMARAFEHRGEIDAAMEEVQRLAGCLEGEALPPTGKDLFCRNCGERVFQGTILCPRCEELVCS
jgi:hypothetical protein